MDFKLVPITLEGFGFIKKAKFGSNTAVDLQLRRGGASCLGQALETLIAEVVSLSRAPGLRGQECIQMSDLTAAFLRILA